MFQDALDDLDDGNDDNVTESVVLTPSPSTPPPTVTKKRGRGRPRKNGQ